MNEGYNPSIPTSPVGGSSLMSQIMVKSQTFTQQMNRDK